MAREVLGHAEGWLAAHIIEPLKSDAPPRARIEALTRTLSTFYAGGKQACLLNVLASPLMERGPFGKEISGAFEKLIVALADTAIEAGVNRIDARSRAERVVMLLQGSLVLSRGLGSTRPFRDMLRTLPNDLLGDL